LRSLLEEIMQFRVATFIYVTVSSSLEAITSAPAIFSYIYHEASDFAMINMAEDKRGSCEIRVEDIGIGFGEKYPDKIFLPFQRLHGRNGKYEEVGFPVSAIAVLQPMQNMRSLGSLYPLGHFISPSKNGVSAVFRA
jgi:light-regulated signal transduction histidine kinase (bacteriophytochrome)